ncbi:hypothetical protein [Paludisphaera mucosa]|uniref:Uncharacterized protein n=1 Tax=Paludisphaera mucosa TaxID=3030827 RepID=A0ABT6FIS1_9BACT|nr:hypothetical protein [Paludisphaera mucosa]MDG3007391.1 hypothetical protein [Paludisphaera mucosa]
MDPDDFQQAWRTQSPQAGPTSEAARRLEDVRREERSFATMIFWRDLREVGVSLLMIPLWVYLGSRNGSPWTWYLMIPALVWVAGYMLANRLRHKARRPGAGEPLRRFVECSLAEVEHQIQLLRSVLWWCLLPFALAALAYFAQITWRERSGGWLTALVAATATAFVIAVLSGVYWLNLHAVRTDLEPRRRELETLLRGLEDETSDVSR